MIISIIELTKTTPVGWNSTIALECQRSTKNILIFHFIQIVCFCLVYAVWLWNFTFLTVFSIKVDSLINFLMYWTDMKNFSIYRNPSPFWILNETIEAQTHLLLIDDFQLPFNLWCRFRTHNRTNQRQLWNRRRQRILKTNYFWKTAF